MSDKVIWRTGGGRGEGGEGSADREAGGPPGI